MQRAVQNSLGEVGDIINAAATAVVKTSAGRSKTTLVVGSPAVVISLYIAP